MRSRKTVDQFGRPETDQFGRPLTVRRRARPLQLVRRVGLEHNAFGSCRQIVRRVAATACLTFVLLSGRETRAEAPETMMGVGTAVVWLAGAGIASLPLLFFDELTPRPTSSEIVVAPLAIRADPLGWAPSSNIGAYGLSRMGLGRAHAPVVDGRPIELGHRAVGCLVAHTHHGLGLTGVACWYCGPDRASGLPIR